MLINLRTFCRHPSVVHASTKTAWLHSQHTIKSNRLVCAAATAQFSTDTSAYKYFVTCNPGLEQTVAETLAGPDVGASNITIGKAGVYCTGTSLQVGYAANLWLTSAIRVLLYLAEAPLQGDNDVYDFFRDAADWASLIPPGCTFSIEARVYDCPGITSGLYVQIRAKDAICDVLRDARGTKPPPPRGTADVPLYAALHRGHITLYRDTSGDSLHRRGYRDAMHKANLNESVAAGALMLADWPRLSQQGARLVDPMCGSGTFLLEAVLMAQHVAPGLFRKRWPFQQWPDHEPKVWLELIQRAQQVQTTYKGTVLGNDVHDGALSLAQRAITTAGLGHLIQLRQGPCRTLRLKGPPDLVVTNPPWALRLLSQHDRDHSGGDAAGRREHASTRAGGRGPGRGPGIDRRARRGTYKRTGVVEGVSEELKEVYEELGDWLKASAPGATAYVLSGNKDATRCLHMRASQKWPITVGGVDCRWLQYQVRGRDDVSRDDGPGRA